MCILALISHLPESAFTKFMIVHKSAMRTFETFVSTKIDQIAT
jgi:hypothetical protein